jgi:hypothetical protein
VPCSLFVGGAADRRDALSATHTVDSALRAGSLPTGSVGLGPGRSTRTVNSDVAD